MMEERRGNIVKDSEGKVMCMEIEKNGSYVIIEVDDEGKWSGDGDLCKGIGLGRMKDGLKSIGGD